jgi:hypothetical protein
LGDGCSAEEQEYEQMNCRSHVGSPYQFVGPDEISGREGDCAYGSDGPEKVATLFRIQNRSAFNKSSKRKAVTAITKGGDADWR